jgi:hypothetical protein
MKTDFETTPVSNTKEVGDYSSLILRCIRVTECKLLIIFTQNTKQANIFLAVAKT